MQNNKIYQYIENIKGEASTHLCGLKKVFLENRDTDSALTQFAFGLFKPNEDSGWHKHPTMIESFYFIKGYGKYYIDKEIVEIKPGTFIAIPENIDHRLLNDHDEDLEFVYFGIAI